MLHKVASASLVVGLLVTGASSGARAQQPAGMAQTNGAPSGWSFNVAPYLWVPTVNTTLNYNLPSGLAGRLPTDLSVDPGQLLSHLDFATAFAADAQYGRFSVLTDFMFMKLNANSAHFKSINFDGGAPIPISSSAQTSTSTTLSATLWTLEGGYTVVQGDWGNFDVIAGFRYFGVDSRTNYSLALSVTGPRGNGPTFGGIGSVSANPAIWNGIGGFRGRIRISNTGFFIPYYFDIGAGGSNLTWQIASGVGYQTGWAGVSLTYRYLSFEQGNNAVVQSLSMGGPMLMVNFSF
jgi:hypothetical protein